MNNQIAVKRRAAVKRNSVNDKTLFTSSRTRAHLRSISSGFLRKIRCSTRAVDVVVVYEKNEATVAFTNGLNVLINAGCELIRKQADQTQRLRAIRGILAHELGHVAYTNFKSTEICIGRLSRGHILPEPVEAPNFRFKPGYDGFKAAVKNPETLDIVIKIILEASNELEDGYVEERIIEGQHGILSDDLEMARKTHFESMTPVNELVEMEEEGKIHRFQVISALLLSYAKFGDIRYSSQDDLDTPHVKALDRCLSYIDEYLDCKDSMRRFALIYTIISLLWQEIESFIEWVKEKRKETQDQQGDGEPGEADDGGATSITKAMPQSAKTPNATTSSTAQDQIGGDDAGDSDGNDQKPGRTGNKSRQAKRSKIARQIRKAAQSEDEERAADTSQGGFKKDGSPDTEEKDAAGKTSTKAADPKEAESTGMSEQENEEESDAELLVEDDKDDTDSEDENQGQKAEADLPILPGDESGGDEPIGISAEEGGRFGDMGEGKAEDGDGDGDARYEETDGEAAYDNAASDIERLLDNVSTDIAEIELDAEQTSKLSAEARSLDLGDIHKNIDVNIKRMTIVPESLIEAYNKVAASVNVIVTHTTRKLEQALKDRRQGGKKSNLYVGRRFESRSAFREDGRVFYSQKLPGGPPPVAFGLLLDESGSMSYMDRATYARMTALIMQGICQKLNVPLAVYGHTTGWNNDIDLHLYASFDSYDQKDKYRMMDINARNANRDGAALRFVGEQLIKRPEETKVLFLVCDGQPADTGYYGDGAEKDLREIKAYLKRKGVDLVVAAIGEDKMNIHRIYGDAYMDITNLQKLPTILPKKLLSYIPE